MWKLGMRYKRLLLAPSLSVVYHEGMTNRILKWLGYQTPLDRKVREGIDFTVGKYGKTLKDLARYDKGEDFSSRHDKEEAIR